MMIKRNIERSNRQYSIDGVPDCWFSTPEDAEAAVLFAKAVASDMLASEALTIRMIADQMQESDSADVVEFGQELLKDPVVKNAPKKSLPEHLLHSLLP
jgi:hypothetical protein